MISIYNQAKRDATKLAIESEISPGIKLYLFKVWMLLSLWIIYKIENRNNNLKRDVV